MMMRLVTILILVVAVVHGQVYTQQEYPEDSLYHDYAMRQEEKPAKVAG